MRNLPETPSVDFLRQEAKDLLGAIRETEPDATLSVAQRALAEGYGFASWAELKAEVERRRAAGAKVAPDIGAELAARFDLGRPARPLGHVDWSAIGERWALDTENGRFMTRTVLDYITQESAEIANSLREAAIAAGVQAPEAVRSTDGSLIEEIDGKKWCVDRWIDVGPTPNLPTTARIATNVGRTLAQLHGTALPPVGQITPWLTARRTPAQWSAILDSVKASEAEWAPLLEDALPSILELTSICVDAPDDEPLLCINDFGPSSVRLLKDDEIAVVHWDFVGTNTPKWELGGALHHWSLGHDRRSVNAVAVRALLSGYRDVAGTVPDLDLSIFTPAICGALNWTNGRISRALDTSNLKRQRRELPEVLDLLKHPLNVATYERILDAANG